jgi:hypothetical protein
MTALDENDSRNLKVSRCNFSLIFANHPASKVFSRLKPTLNLLSPELPLAVVVWYVKVMPNAFLK